MPDLHLIGVHEDGKHVLLADRAGAQFRLPIDDALRSVLRREYVDHSRPAEPLRPIEVQAMIRAGASAAEAAQRAGWPVEKVHRYEGPILAEREHIAQLAGRAHVPATGALHPVTLRERVDERLEQRGVPLDDVDWDSWRSEDGQWTVEMTFAAGGRRRTAAWHFSRSSMTVVAIDDESRWLSGEDHGGAGHASARDAAGGTNATGAMGAMGGALDTATRSEERSYGRDDTGRSGDAHGSGAVGWSGAASAGQSHRESASAAFSAPQRATPHDPDSELTAGLRERAAARGRRRPRRLAAPAAETLPTVAPVAPSAPSAPSARTTSPAPEVPAAPASAAVSGPAPTDIPDTGIAVDPDAVPLAAFDYDPETDGAPPGAHSDPDPDGPDGRPEAAAASAVDESDEALTPDSSSSDTGSADSGSSDTTSRPAAETSRSSEAATAAPADERPAAPAPAPRAAAPRSAPKASRPARPAATEGSRSVASEGVEEPELPLHHDEPQDATPAAAAAASTPEPTGTTPAPAAAAADGASRQQAGAPTTPPANAAKTASASTGSPVATASGSTASGATASGATASGSTRTTRKRTAASRAPRRAATSSPAATPSPQAKPTPATPAAATPAASKAAPAKPAAGKPAPPTPPAAKARSAQSAAERPAPTKPAPAPQEPAPTDAAAEPAAAPARKTMSARRNRASVPAWDDIMFGAKPPSS